MLQVVRQKSSSSKSKTLQSNCQTLQRHRQTDANTNSESSAFKVFLSFFHPQNPRTIFALQTLHQTEVQMKIFEKRHCQTTLGDTMLFSLVSYLIISSFIFFCLFIMILQLYLNNIIDFSPLFSLVYMPSQFIFFSSSEEEQEKERRKKNSLLSSMSSQIFRYENYGYLHSINITLVVVGGCLVVWR